MSRSTVFVAVTIACLVLPELSFAQEVVIIRHAERASESDTDSPLKKEGHDRALRLVTVLKDAGITAIYTSKFQRTIQTGAPLAKALGLTPSALSETELVKALKGLAANARILVVGHSNTIPQIVSGLGVTAKIANPVQGYDNMFVVTQRQSGASTLLHLRYY
jgi:phosphohistidine phosphatase SixA